MLLPAVLILAACSARESELHIPFVAVLGGQTIACGSGPDGASISDLRFYVSDVQVLDEQGEGIDVALSVDGHWQQENLALLDLEDGTAGCDNGTAITNASIHGKVPAGNYRGLRFTVGVPFDRNHRDPLLATAPLGDPAMHWHWRAGYKFMRAGIRTATDGFWIHLGSTGCEGTVRNITSCRFPNRVQVILPDHVPGQDIIVVDLGQLVATTDLEDQSASDCSSGPAEESCATPFAAFGLDFRTGGRLPDQTVFQSRRHP